MTEQPESQVEEPEEVPTPEETTEEPSLGEIQIPEKPAQPEVPAVDQSKLASIGEEIIRSGGKISDEQYAALAEAGFADKSLVDEFFAGRMALREQQKSTVYKELGGKEMVDKALQWASENLSAEQIAELNADLSKATIAGQTRILKGLISDMGGVTSALKGNTGASTANAPFKTLDEFHAAMADPKYKSDPAYQQSVERRLAASNIRVSRR